MTTRISLQLSDGSYLYIWLQLSMMLLISLFAELAMAGGKAFYDYARVLKVDPISETVAVPVEKRRCFYPDRAIQAVKVLAGDVRSRRSSITIGAAIAEEVEQRKQTTRKRRCRLVKTIDIRDKVVAYRVRYQYGGDVFVRRMKQHPGEQLLVRVKMEPL